MDRRTALRNMIVIGGGMAFFPACMNKGEDGASIELRHLKATADDEAILAEFVDTLIPETDTPGAKSLNLHLYVFKMLDDCHGEEDQQMFMAGLREMDGLAKDRFSQSFTALERTDRETLMQEIGRRDEEDNLRSFYWKARIRCQQGYLNSKYYMTQVQKYELVPGRYNGYFPAGTQAS